MPPLCIVRPGRVPYDEAVALQERLRVRRQELLIPDTLLLLEHPPVITLGRAARAEHLLLDEASLARRGVQVREAARGGDVTYHGPGQVVGYPIFHLEAHGRDVHRFLRGVEEAILRTLAEFGLRGERVPGLTGVWVGRDKVAAIGIGVRRWVTWHGFALNVSTDLDAFGLIVPCGIRDRGVTSLERLLEAPVDCGRVERRLAAAFGDVFGLRPEEGTLGVLAGASAEFSFE